MITTLKEQARQSGLVLSNEPPEWNFEDWPPLEGGWRYYHASVVLNPTDNNKEQTVVVLGGYRTGQGEVNSILVLNLAESNKQWREGPRMNQKRDGHAAVVCNGGIYVMGGDNGGSDLNCMERIDANETNGRRDGRTSTRRICHQFRSCIELGKLKQAVARRATNEQESSRTFRCCVQRKHLRDGRSQYSNFGLYRTH